MMVVVGLMSVVVAVTVVVLVEVLLIAVTVVLGVTVVVVVAVVVVLVGALPVVIVVVRALACAGATIDTFVDGRVDFLMDAFANIRLGVLRNIGDEVLMGVNVNMCAVVMTAFEFAMSGPLEECRC